MIEVKQNFDWADTERDLVVFMPNFNGKRLTEESILRLKTVVHSSRFMIIVGNDNVEDNWDHLRTQNVASFTLLRDSKDPRNGAFIRNYAIKRCRSKYFMQKDGEVCLEGDPIGQVVLDGWGSGWRPGWVAALSPEQTENYLCNSILPLGLCRRVEPVAPCCVELAKRYLLDLDGKVNFASYYHYAYCVRTDRLQSMQGYDERYTHYGWEDVDMYLRLASAGTVLRVDPSSYAVHLHHPSTVNKAMLEQMKHIFEMSDPYKVLRNEDYKWGEGE